MNFFFSGLLLLAFVYLAYRVSPRERQEDAFIHGAGQVGVLAAIALFGVDYFTSFYYATGEMMASLHPFGLEHLVFVPVGFIALANFVFGVLYMYSLGVFNEGGGSFTASMRYLGPSISLIVAVVLIQDYVLTIVVSTLSGVDQLLSIRDMYGIPWFWHFAIGAVLAMSTWYLTIRGRGESAAIVFTLLGIFILLTITMAVGLFLASARNVPPLPAIVENPPPVNLWTSFYHMLTASMKGLVALSGLEAMSNGIQFVRDQDVQLVKWGKKHAPKLTAIWNFYSGKSGIGRIVQTSFLFYGGLTTLFLASFALKFNAFDGTEGRSLVANLAFVGFNQVPGGVVLYYAYQILAVLLLAAASLTAYQDIQAMAWRNVAIGEIPEVVVYRNPKGTFTRPVTAAVVAAIIVQLLVRGETGLAVPYYGVGVFLPITAMGFAIRQHIKKHSTGRARTWGMLGATMAGSLGAIVFVGQIVGKWSEGGWVVLISLAVLILMAHGILLSPAGYRDARQIQRIIRDKSRVQGTMGNIAEWQSLETQGYRYRLLLLVAKFWELFGVRRPLRFEPPAPAGTYEEAVEHGKGDEHSILSQYIPKEEPHLGGPPPETQPPEEGAPGSDENELPKS